MPLQKSKLKNLSTMASAADLSYYLIVITTFEKCCDESRYAVLYLVVITVLICCSVLHTFISGERTIPRGLWTNDLCRTAG